MPVKIVANEASSYAYVSIDERHEAGLEIELTPDHSNFQNKSAVPSRTALFYSRPVFLETLPL